MIHSKYPRENIVHVLRNINLRGFPPKQWRATWCCMICSPCVPKGSSSAPERGKKGKTMADILIELWNCDRLSGFSGFFFSFLCRRTIIRPPNHTVNGNTNIIRISQSYFYVRFYVFSHIKTCREKTATVNQQNERARLYGPRSYFRRAPARCSAIMFETVGRVRYVWITAALSRCAVNMHHRDEKPLSEGVCGAGVPSAFRITAAEHDSRRLVWKWAPAKGWVLSLLVAVASFRCFVPSGIQTTAVWCTARWETGHRRKKKKNNTPEISIATVWRRLCSHDRGLRFICA